MINFFKKSGNEYSKNSQEKAIDLAISELGEVLVCLNMESEFEKELNYMRSKFSFSKKEELIYLWGFLDGVVQKCKQMESDND